MVSEEVYLQQPKGMHKQIIIIMSALSKTTYATLWLHVSQSIHNQNKYFSNAVPIKFYNQDILWSQVVKA